jgi:hypothetical protein
VDHTDPDEHTFEPQKLLAHLADHIVRIDGGLSVNAERGQRLEHAIESIVDSGLLRSAFGGPCVRDAQACPPPALISKPPIYLRFRRKDA